MIITNFIKCHSLGNDFMLFDLQEKDRKEIETLRTPAWQATIQKLCTRHTGVGADGALVLHKKNNTLIAEIYNCDGTKQTICLNGARCIAHYLFTQCNYPQYFSFDMGGVTITSDITDNGTPLITQHINMANSCKEKTLTITDSTGQPRTLTGYFVDIGNPHFIIFEKTTLAWLEQNGHLIEQHTLFPNKTNVEFVWPEQTPGSHNFLVFERDCGITQACGSGAAATTSLLFLQNKIKHNEKITFTMPGGPIPCWVTPDGQVALQASAQIVFTGTFFFDTPS